MPAGMHSGTLGVADMYIRTYDIPGIPITFEELELKNRLAGLSIDIFMSLSSSYESSGSFMWEQPDRSLLYLCKLLGLKCVMFERAASQYLRLNDVNFISLPNAVRKQ